jgi:FkbM family methyltransferase
MIWHRTPRIAKVGVKSMFGIASRRGLGQGLAGAYSAYLSKVPSEHTIAMRFGQRIDLRLFDFLPDIVFRHGIWEPGATAIAAAHLRAGDVAIDLGANIGCHTLLFSHLVGSNGRVVAVEAVPTTAQRLRKTLANNTLSKSNVTVVEAAVGPVAKAARIFVRQTSTGSASVFRQQGTGEIGHYFDLDVRPPREVLRREDVAAARVIKLDFEGGEMGVVVDLLRADWLNPDCILITELTTDFETVGLAEFFEFLRQHDLIACEYTNLYTDEFYRDRSPIECLEVTAEWVTHADGGVADVVIGSRSALAAIGIPGKIARARFHT